MCGGLVVGVVNISSLFPTRRRFWPAMLRNVRATQSCRRRCFSALPTRFSQGSFGFSGGGWEGRGDIFCWGTSPFGSSRPCFTSRARSGSS